MKLVTDLRTTVLRCQLNNKRTFVETNHVVKQLFIQKIRGFS